MHHLYPGPVGQRLIKNEAPWPQPWLTNLQLITGAGQGRKQLAWNYRNSGSQYVPWNSKNKENQRERKKLFIFLLMEIISRGHDIGWVWDPGINVCLHVAECFFFERTWEVGSRQCLLVAIRAGREPLLRGKTSLGAYRAFVSQPRPTHPWDRLCLLLSLERSLWLFWPLVSAN